MRKRWSFWQKGCFWGIHLLVFLLTLTAFSSAGASISISVNPNSLPANEKGTALISIADLASSGNRVWVDIFIDANNNGVIDAGESEVESFAVTDGTGSPQIAGVMNTNVNGDEDGDANSSITTTLKCYDVPFDAGQFIIQATDIEDSSTATATFTCTQNTSLPQSISGTITCNGSPVAGAFVWIEASSECDVAGAVTNSSGDYQIYLENPGTYCIAVSAQGYVSKGNDGDSYLCCIIVDGHETGINPKLFSGTHHITGTLRDRDTGLGIGGVWIEAKMENGIKYCSETITNHNGNFDIMVIDGVWELKAQGGLETKGYVKIDNADDDIIVSGSDVHGKDACFPPVTALIIGTVKDENGGPVVAEIEGKTKIDGIQYKPDALIDPEGNYVLGVIAGHWGVKAELECELYLRQPPEQYIDIAENEVKTLNFICTQAGAVSGNVKDSNNQPIEGLWVYVFSEACGGEWLGGDHTDCNGDYIIGWLPAGNVYVQTCAECCGLDYISEWYDDKTHCSDADAVYIIVSEITENVDFQLSKLCEGDFDHDGDVDGLDLAVFAAHFGRTDCANPPPCEGDFDDDDDVDGSDLAVFAADFGRTDCPR